MEVKISKELVSAVLQIDIKDISIIGSTLNYTIPNHETEEDGELVYIDLGQNINIYEFAFKCKEWALKKGYIIQSELEGYTFENIAYAICRVYFDGDKVYDNYELNNICYQYEKMGIIESCEWVLKETQKCKQ